MSSESLGHDVEGLFEWNANLAREDYLFVRYRIEAHVPAAAAALGMAREQSAATLRVPHATLHDLARHTARVVDLHAQGRALADLQPRYRLVTPVYADEDSGTGDCEVAEVVIAFPHATFAGSVLRLLNHVYGELPRLGFIGAVRMLDIEFPHAALTRFGGPGKGVAGVRERLGVAQRPLFCRSTRPAVGKSLDEMLAIARAVLSGGFDLVKDDELTQDLPGIAAEIRCAAFQQLMQEVQASSGERKGFVVNLLEEPDDAQRIATTAAALGVFGGLIAPGLQGFGAIRSLSFTRGLVALAHNTGSDAYLRSPRHGIAPALWIKLCRLAGADMVLLPGDFATASMSRAEARAQINAALAPLGGLAPTLPILAGGKRAQELGAYRDFVGSADFMLIVAAAVDDHAQGPEIGAQDFRAAWTALTR
jgi:ribulose-bisphosphate carboxylase large chain